MIHLIQIGNGSSRRVAIAEGSHLRCLTEMESVYELARRCLRFGVRLSEQAHSLAIGETLDYDAIYAGAAEWKLLAPIDVPGEPSRLLISGTGLTHLGSAKDRQAMHISKLGRAIQTGGDDAPSVTDSMRMYQSGVEGGRPTPGQIGIAPEWFYKG